MDGWMDFCVCELFSLFLHIDVRVCGWAQALREKKF